MNHRVLRAVPKVTLGLAAMALAAYALGRVTRSEWVWWLAPLTVALDGSLLLRARLSDGAKRATSFETPLVDDLNVPMCFAWSIAVAGMAAAGAYTGNRVALITGATLAILGNALEQGEEPALEQYERAGITPCRNGQPRYFAKPSRRSPNRITFARAREDRLPLNATLGGHERPSCG